MPPKKKRQQCDKTNNIQHITILLYVKTGKEYQFNDSQKAILSGLFNCVKASTLLIACEACPSQWEGNLDDGRMFYIRYRWGFLSVRVSRKVTNDVDEAVLGESVLEVGHDNDWDGCMPTKDMQGHTSHVVDWSNVAV